VSLKLFDVHDSRPKKQERARDKRTTGSKQCEKPQPFLDIDIFCETVLYYILDKRHAMLEDECMSQPRALAGQKDFYIVVQIPDDSKNGGLSKLNKIRVRPCR
jgi:hypothetical protein